MPPEQVVNVTPQDTADTFIGSGALSYSWWRVCNAEGIAQLDSPDDWFVVLVDEDGSDEPGTPVRVDHAVIMQAVQRLARAAPEDQPGQVRDDVVVECRVFLADPQDADFDADSADQVLQYIAFGSVIYG